MSSVTIISLEYREKKLHLHTYRNRIITTSSMTSLSLECLRTICPSSRKSFASYQHLWNLKKHSRTLVIGHIGINNADPKNGSKHTMPLAMSVPFTFHCQRTVAQVIMVINCTKVFKEKLNHVRSFDMFLICNCYRFTIYNLPSVTWANAWLPWVCGATV